MQLTVSTVVVEHQTHVGKPLKNQSIVLLFSLNIISSFIFFANPSTPKVLKNCYLVFSIFFKHSREEIEVVSKIMRPLGFLHLSAWYSLKTWKDPKLVLCYHSVQFVFLNWEKSLGYYWHQLVPWTWQGGSLAPWRTFPSLTVFWISEVLHCTQNEAKIPYTLNSHIPWIHFCI